MPDGTKFEYELMRSMDEVRAKISECEGQHVQQAIFSTLHGHPDPDLFHRTEGEIDHRLGGQSVVVRREPVEMSDLDQGIDPDEWVEDEPVLVEILHGRLFPGVGLVG